MKIFDEHEVQVGEKKAMHTSCHGCANENRTSKLGWCSKYVECIKVIPSYPENYKRQNYTPAPTDRGTQSSGLPKTGTYFEQAAPKVAGPLDTIEELRQITGTLAALIAQGQDDDFNNFLCDAYDAAEAAYRKAIECAYDEFLDDTPPKTYGRLKRVKPPAPCSG